jgi:hypothetical protein
MHPRGDAWRRSGWRECSDPDNAVQIAEDAQRWTMEKISSSTTQLRLWMTLESEGDVKIGV